MKRIKREQQVLNYIKEYMKKCGVTPTMREICLGVGLKSTSSVFVYMEKLEKAGLIERFDKCSRYRVQGMRYVDESVYND